MQNASTSKVCQPDKFLNESPECSVRAAVAAQASKEEVQYSLTSQISSQIHTSIRGPDCRQIIVPANMFTAATTTALQQGGLGEPGYHQVTMFPHTHAHTVVLSLSLWHLH